MEKISAGQSFKTNSTTTRASASTKRSENPEISSRWDEVQAKERRQQGDKNEDYASVGQNPENKPLFVGAPKKNPNQTKTKEVGSPFDLFNKVSDLLVSKDEEMSLSEFHGDQAGMQVMEVPIMTDLEQEEVNFFVEGEQLDLPGVGLVLEKKESSKIHLHEDLSFLNPSPAPVFIAALHGVTGEVSAKKPVNTNSSAMDELAARLVEEISIVKQDGRTETTIHLKNAGLFTDAQVTLTEFDTAKNELNIRFENLTQQAHEILSMHTNRESLKVALEQKGYNVHIITANTEIEQAEKVYKGHQDRSGSDKQPDHQDRQEQPQRDKKR
jgi:hypothetical protein